MEPKNPVILEKLTLKEIFDSLLGEEKAKKVISEIYAEIEKKKKGEALRSSIIDILARHKVKNSKMSTAVATSASRMSQPPYSVGKK